MRTLLVGNTGYITNKFVEEAFPESLVMVMGDTNIRKNRKKNLFVRPFVKNEKELEDIFSTYDFEQIIYFSNYLTFHGETRGEAEMLRKILQLCRGKRNMRIVYLTGPERLYDVTTGKTLLVSEMENLSREYAKLYKTTVKIIRSPYLYSEPVSYTHLDVYKRQGFTKERSVFAQSTESCTCGACNGDTGTKTGNTCNKSCTKISETSSKTIS